MITIIVLIVLAGISINLVFGNLGIVTKEKEAKEENLKQTAKEVMNLKITSIQIENYTENKTLPSLQFLADKLCEDNDMEYVLTQSKAHASLDKIDTTNLSSIYTKLKEYPYEFEINDSLQLASIDGEKVATVPTNDKDTIGSMTKAELTELINTQIESALDSIGTVYESSSVTTTWSKTTWTKLRTITLEPGNYIVELTFVCSTESFSGSGNTFIGLGSGTSLDNMGIWTDYKSSSELSTPYILKMNAIKIK